MGFLLTISKGLLQGRELAFEQPEIHIGRTPENDVVLQDAGVSRRHVRISERLGRYFAQDLGSANGTLLNDSPLTEERMLSDGDRITLGPAELVFKAVVDDDDSTRPIRRNLNPPRAEPPRPSGPPVLTPVTEAPAKEARKGTGQIPVLTPATVAPAKEARKGTGQVPVLTPATVAPAKEARKGTGQVPVLTPATAAPPPPPGVRRATMGQMPAVSAVEPRPPVLVDPEAPTTLPRRATMGQMPVASVSDAPLARPEPSPTAPVGKSSPVGSSAAEKARRRRELGGTLGGQFLLWWSELSGGGKFTLFLLACCFVLGMGAAFNAVFRPAVGNMGPTGPEPKTLGLQGLPDSFGLGEGVKWEQPDMKAFDFEFVSPTRAVVVIRYHASGISKDEVSLSVNAVPVGYVPADTLNASEREVQQIVSPSVLKRNERNQVVFDNVRNPPGQDGWRVWNLRLEIIPVPDLPPEQLMETARNYVARGRVFYEQRDVGAENLFRAWDNFRSAWITLEALDDKPELYQDVRFMLNQVAADLDHKCGQLMLDFQRNIQFKDRKRAGAVLDDVNRRFPTAAHRCHNLAFEKANEYGL
ncbi:MAG TPA: FHA domain-containing protein [Archangium sp.]|uniref:FHA domain-containing protein n=1 Tax=Archangium sp. TaxID=1872627 RepID=UPI002EDA0E2E